MIDFSNPPFVFKTFNINYFEIADQVLSYFNDQKNIKTFPAYIMMNNKRKIKYLLNKIKKY